MRFAARWLACMLLTVVLMLFLKARDWDRKDLGIAGAVFCGALVGSFAVGAEGLSFGRRLLASGAGVLACLVLAPSISRMVGHDFAFLVALGALGSGVASGVAFRLRPGDGS